MTSLQQAYDACCPAGAPCKGDGLLSEALVLPTAAST